MKDKKKQINDDQGDLPDQFLNCEQLNGLYANTLDIIPALFFAITLDGKIIHINNAFEEHYNRIGQVSIGQSVFELLNDEEINQLKEIRDKIQTTGSVHIFERKETDTKGETRVYQSYYFPYYDQSNHVYAIGSVSLDKTSKRKLESELKQSQESALKNANMAALGEMAAGIAHEVNNPLAIISGNANLIDALAEAGQLNVEDLPKYTEKIERAVDRIQSIIKGMRNFARQDTNQPAQIISVQSIVNEVIGFCRERFQANSVTLRCEVPEQEILVHCHSHQIGQILVNLLNNAHDAACDQESPWVEISVSLSDSKVKVTVTDCGPGIKPEVSQRIFKPFFTTKEVGKGSGLGLSLSKNIAKAHSGDLYYENDSENTRFSLVLPYVTQKNRAA